jgi:hypothetical protein
MTTTPNVGDFTDKEAAAVGRMVLDLARQRIDQIGQEQAVPDRQLDEMRAAADVARRSALAAQSWDDLCPVVELFDSEHEYLGEDAVPRSDVERLFGQRLAFDLLSCEFSRDVMDTLAMYSNLIKRPDQLARVVLAALGVIACDVVPLLLANLENSAGDYTARTGLVEAARKAWEAQAGDEKDIEWC